MSFSLIFSIVPFYNVSAIVDDSNNLDDYTVAKQEVPSDHEITTVDENGNVISLETVEQNMPDTSDDLDEKDLFVQPEEQSRARASNSSVSVVNFRTKSSSKENTEYKEDGEVLVKTGAYTQKDKDGKDVVIPTTFVKDGQAKYAIEDTKTIKKDVIDVNLGNFFQ